jgi:hypothetical protein
MSCMLVEDMIAKVVMKKYASCKFHLVNGGRQVGIDDDILDTSLDPDECDQCVLETLDMVGLLQHYHKAKKPQMKPTLKKMLHYICRFKYINECIAFEERVARALVTVDNCVPCIPR